MGRSQYRIIAAAFLSLFVSLPLYAQTSTTDTKTKTQTKSETKTFQSKDGTRKKTETTTKTQSDQRSITKTVPAPNNNVRNNDRDVPNRDIRRSQRAQGEWDATVAGRACIINIYGGFEAGGGGATSSGCPGELADIGNWQLQGGHTLVLTKSLIVPVATLRRQGPYNFVGTTRDGQRIVLAR